MLLVRGEERPPGVTIFPAAAGHRLAGPGKAMCAACPTVPSIAAIWACVARVMMSQSQQSQDVPSPRPGKVSNAASVVLPCVIAYRPISTWTNTLMTQLSRISQSRLYPALAPRLVVLISSPVPTIEAARIRPGPIWRIAVRKVRGGSWMAQPLPAIRHQAVSQ